MPVIWQRVGNILASFDRFGRPQAWSAPATEIAGDHLSVVAQSATCGQVMPPGEAAQTRIGAQQHASGQDRLAVAQDEFAFDGSLDAANA